MLPPLPPLPLTPPANPSQRGGLIVSHKRRWQADGLEAGGTPRGRVNPIHPLCQEPETEFLGLLHLPRRTVINLIIASFPFDRPCEEACPSVLCLRSSIHFLPILRERPLSIRHSPMHVLLESGESNLLRKRTTHSCYWASGIMQGLSLEARNPSHLGE